MAYSEFYAVSTNLDNSHILAIPQLRRLNVLLVSMVILDYAKYDPGAAERICSSAARLFKSLWDRRDAAWLSHSAARRDKDVDVDVMKLWHKLTCIYYEVYREYGFPQSYVQCAC